jgi:hypothetical protein
MFFGHTLLCYLSPTWMFNKPTSKPFQGNLEKKGLQLQNDIAVQKESIFTPKGVFLRSTQEPTFI